MAKSTSGVMAQWYNPLYGTLEPQNRFWVQTGWCAMKAMLAKYVLKPHFSMYSIMIALFELVKLVKHFLLTWFFFIPYLIGHTHLPMSLICTIYICCNLS
jgi:hypothetical protein